MSLSNAEIEAVVRDLRPRLEGGRIERIDQPAPDRLILTVRHRAYLCWLLICTDPRASRLHLLTHRPETGPPAAGFCNAVRQRLTGAPVLALRQVPDDRVVVIESEERDRLMNPHRVCLVAELVGVGSNLILTDEDDRVLAALSREESERRTIAPGSTYVPLEPPRDLPARARENRFAGASGTDDPLALSRAIQAHYAEAEARARLDEKRATLVRRLTSALKRRRRRLRAIERDLRVAENAEQIRRRAELLAIALPRLERGQREVVVEDVFEPERPEVTIQLDPAVPPAENVERLFRRYKKAKAGRDRLAGRLQETKRQIAALETLRNAAREAGSEGELAEVQAAAGNVGLRPAQAPARRTVERRVGLRSFESADGLEILVARNARENERLTFSIVRGNDYWFHVVDWRGPHVVVRMPAGGDLPGETLLDAAHLAVHFSKARGAERAEVGYTRCKNVRRMKGGGPGRVSYSDGRTIRVRMEPGRLGRLLADRERRAPQ
jgi:predicted ribosome quality control (RQC) complex YloA/Tae2 family protein